MRTQVEFKAPRSPRLREIARKGVAAKAAKRRLAVPATSPSSGDSEQSRMPWVTFKRASAFTLFGMRRRHIRSNLGKLFPYWFLVATRRRVVRMRRPLYYIGGCHGSGSGSLGVIFRITSFRFTHTLSQRWVSSAFPNPKPGVSGCERWCRAYTFWRPPCCTSQRSSPGTRRLRRGS